MKKFILIIACAFVAILSINAQTTFTKGDRVLNLGLGIGNRWGGANSSVSIPPISGSIEFCVKDNLFDDKSSLGVSGLFSYMSYNYKYNNISSSTHSNVMFGARGALHYEFIEKLDTYAGLGLYYNVWGGGDGVTFDNGIGLGFFLGGRYYFTDNIAGLLEFGYDVSAANIGVAIKF